MSPVQESQHLHHDDDRILTDAWRNGDLGAAGRLVERYQPELLRVAFLLTGQPDSVPDLVTATLLDFFKATQRTLPAPDIRTALITGLTRRYLAPDPGRSSASGSQAALAGSWTGGERFNVDNERSRALAALASLAPAGRVAIVLADLAHLPHLPGATVCELSGLSTSEIDALRERLRFVAGLDNGAKLHSLLVAAALGAPRVDVWETVKDALDRQQQAARQRARLINAGAVAVTFVVAATLIWFLLGLDSQPGSKTVGDEENVARNPTPGSSLDGPAQSANPTPLPPPTATPLPTPAADVPNILLVRRESSGGQTTLLHRFSAGAQQVLSVSGSGEFHEAGTPIVAPDGNQIIMLWYRYVDGAVQGVVTAHDGDLQRTTWSTEVATYPFEGGPGSQEPVFLVGAVDDERVYVVVHPWESSDPVEIVALRRDDGAVESRTPTTVAGFVVHSIRVVAPRDHDAVYLFAISQDEPPQHGEMQMIFLAYRMPDGERIHGRTLADKPESRAFFLYDSRLTPGHDYLYDVDYTNANGELAVHFLNLVEGQLEPRVLLPFEPVADPLPYQQVTSHDGRWLYVLSPASRQVAVVDLATRKLAGVVPLNMGRDYAGTTVAASYFPNRQMQLSPDGRTIYALGAGMSPATSPTGIWVIDVPTWTLSEVWIPDVPVGRLIVAGENDLYASLPGGINLSGADQPSTGIQLVPFEALSAETPDGLETLATLYRSVYGSSPSVEGRAPGNASDFYPLAAMSVLVDERLLEPDERAEIDVRFVNPLTGVPVFEGADEAGARYTPPISVRAVLTQADQKILLELGKASHGWYRGSVVLPSSGEWRMTVVARWSGERADERRQTYPWPIQVRGLVGSFPGSSLDIWVN